MEEVLKREFIIKGLHCANCAAKIERGIQSITGVHKASIDFVGRRLVLEYKNPKDAERILDEAIKTIDSIEDGVEIIEKKSAIKEEPEENSSGIRAKEVFGGAEVGKPEAEAALSEGHPPEPDR